MRKSWALFFLVILMVSVHGRISACTIFVVKTESKVLVGNNEDYWYSVNAEMWFEPAERKSFGRVLFGWGGFAQGGMNDKGLFFDAADVAATGEEKPRSLSTKTKSTKPLFKGNIGEEALKKCSTTEEVIGLIESYNFPDLVNGHLMFADGKGDSFVAEWVDGELTILKRKGSYQIITNYFLSQSQPSGAISLRQDRVEELLNQKADITGGYAASILKNVAQYGEENGKIGGTLYSNVYDLIGRRLVVFYKRDFSNPLTIDLATELNKGRHSVKLDAIFHSK